MAIPSFSPSTSPYTSAQLARFPHTLASPCLPFRIDHLAGAGRVRRRVLRQCLQAGGHADGEGALLRVAELDLLDRGQLDVEVHHPELGVRVEDDGPRLGQHEVLFRPDPVECGGERAGLAAALQFSDLPEHDAPQILPVVAGLVRPEIDAVHIPVSKPQAAVMGMVGGLAGHLLHGKIPRNDGSGSRPERMQVGFRGFGADEEFGEGLPVDIDGNPVTSPRQRHLSAERHGRHEDSQALVQHARY